MKRITRNKTKQSCSTTNVLVQHINVDIIK